MGKLPGIGEFLPSVPRVNDALRILYRIQNTRNCIAFLCTCQGSMEGYPSIFFILAVREEKDKCAILQVNAVHTKTGYGIIIPYPVPNYILHFAKYFFSK